MKTKEMNGIINLCEPFAKQLIDNVNADLNKVFNGLIEIKSKLEKFVNENQGIEQRTYLKLENLKQEFCDETESIVDNIEELEELFENEGNDMFNDVMNFEDVICSLFNIMKYKKERTKAVTLSLTEQEEKDLIKISENFLGTSNKSGMVRYWINLNNLKNCKREGISYLE